MLCRTTTPPRLPVHLTDRCTGYGAAGSERLAKIRDQVVEVFDTHREPDQIARHLERGSGGGGVRHPARVLDQRLDAAQGLAQREELRAVADADRRLLDRKSVV